MVENMPLYVDRTLKAHLRVPEKLIHVEDLMDRYR